VESDTHNDWLDGDFIDIKRFKPRHKYVSQSVTEEKPASRVCKK